ncbi:checkpoint serine/threonine-protein kinase, partial [Tremellales sp. Uapishka_1]
MESLFSPLPPLRPPSPAATPITDFALIESQKENIRPLASGRSAATLSTLFEKESSAAEKVISEGHERFRRDIEEAERRDKEGEDMVDGVPDILEVYNRYILFTVQHHPSSATHLLPLLESTTRRFLADARYAQDTRYLKLWVMYTRHVERREDVWAFLDSREVGTHHAVFYEEWASAADALGRRKKADEIFRLGLARKAAPVERLKSRHAAYLARILTASGTIPEDDPAALLPARSSGRSVLGTVASASSGSAISGAIQSAPSTRIPTRNPNGSKMEVFSDVAGNGEDGTAGEWADFGTRDGRRKENTVEAGPWRGEVLPQSAARGRVAPRTPKVEVFKDTGDDGGVRAAEDVFSRSKQPLTEAELLKSDPLRHYDTSSVSTSLPSLPAAPVTRKPHKPHKSHFVMQPWECPTDGPEVKGNGGKVERRMFDWSAVYKGGEEWSFEEVRARQRGLLGKEWRGQIQDWEGTWHMPGSSTPKKEEPKKRMPSPTVNTKLADQEIMGMFNQTIGGDQHVDTDSDSSEEEESDDDMPMQALPTPLPVPAMMIPGRGMVPPTPTPAPGYVSQHRAFADENVPASKLAMFSDENAPKPMVFSDENAVPKPARLNVFNETPAKTPLATRTPLAVASASKPRAFGVFVEEQEPEPESQPQQSGIRATLQKNIFATPAPARFGANYEKEAENGEQLEEEEAPKRLRRFQINEMTPITERTGEFTSHTTASRRVSSATTTISEDEEEDAAMASHPEPVSHLSAVEEEEEKSVSTRGESRSGSAEPKFVLPEGYTIAMKEDFNSMVIDDGTEFHTAQLVPPSPAGIPNPCNPADEDVLANILESIQPPLVALPGFHDFRTITSKRLDSLQKAAKAKVRRSSTSSRVSNGADDQWNLEIQGRLFEIREKIGEGGFGAVFLGIDVQARQLQDEKDDDESDEDEDGDECLVAIKVENPASVWEALVLDRIHARIEENLRSSIIKAKHLYCFADESFLLLEYCSQGTLLDIVNKASSIGIAPSVVSGGQVGMDELLAVFFTIELLKLVEGLHSKSFIHGDLKIDNCLVRLEEIPNNAWDTQYDMTGKNGWASKGVKLIDFGRAIDLTLYPARESQRFIADWKVDERDCTEMREGKEWSYHTDYFGLASIAYCMLFGKYISTEKVEGRIKIATPLKRYWQTALWTALFDALLNPPELPMTDGLTAIRGEFEVWLEENCQKGGKVLKPMLKKIEMAALRNRRG